MFYPLFYRGMSDWRCAAAKIERERREAAGMTGIRRQAH
jgi:hypothetical protein